MNGPLLKAKIVSEEMSVKSFCELAGFNRTTFDRKIGGKSEFNLDELMKIMQYLHLTDAEMKNIFFTKEVA